MLRRPVLILPTKEMFVLELRNVTKVYGSTPVVDDVSLSIPRGKITSFIGPNGAGKSTLLSLMSRLIPRNGGSITVDGRDILQWNSTELARKLSILRQANHTNLRLTVKELVAFGRFPHNPGQLTQEDWRYVDQALEYMALGDLANRYLNELSGGQRQRAYIAMVIAQNTDYVFLDEPLNNLDMRHAVDIMKTLRKLVRDFDKTVVIVLHDINFASCYSDYIAAMDQGRIADEGCADHIIQQEVLNPLYQLDFDIQEVNQQRICVYY